jgi:hypothetical protein
VPLDGADHEAVSGDIDDGALVLLLGLGNCAGFVEQKLVRGCIHGITSKTALIVNIASNASKARNWRNSSVGTQMKLR